MKVLKAGVASLLFLGLQLGVYWIHVRYVRVDVVFYAAITDVYIAALVAALVLFGIRFFALFTGFEKTLLMGQHADELIDPFRKCVESMAL